MTSSSLLRRGSITVINRPSFPSCCDVALCCYRCCYCCYRCCCFSSPSSASSLAALSCKIDNSIIVPWCPVFAVAVMLCHSGCCFSTTFISSHEVSISWHRKSSSSSVNHLNLLHLHRLSPLHSELLLLQRFRRAQASQRRFTTCIEQHHHRPSLLLPLLSVVDVLLLSIFSIICIVLLSTPVHCCCSVFADAALMVAALSYIAVSPPLATRWTLPPSLVKPGAPVSGGGTVGAAITCRIDFSPSQVVDRSSFFILLSVV